MVVAQAGLAGSARIGRGAVIMSQAGIPDHVTIGERAYVGPKSGVHGDVADGARVMGYPHRDMRAFQRIFAALGLLPALVARVRALERGPGAGDARQAPARARRAARAGAAARRADGSRGAVARGAARALPRRERRRRARSAGSPRCGGTRAAARARSRARSSGARTPSAGSRRGCDGLFALRARLLAAGARCVAGVDEVGMGPLAGPVLAAAVILPERPSLPGLDDSKRLSRAARERIAARIHEQALAVGLGIVEPGEIDRLNIYRAGLEAMRRAVLALARAPDHVLVDARTIPGLACAQTAIVGGDALDGSIAAASIVAKVARDAIMRRLDERHPGWGLAQHMGYPTPQHLAALRAPRPLARPPALVRARRPRRGRAAPDGAPAQRAGGLPGRRDSALRAVAARAATPSCASRSGCAPPRSWRASSRARPACARPTSATPGARIASP